MKRLLLLFLITIIMLSFAGCDPIETYSEEDLQIILKDIKTYLLNSDMSTYYLSKELTGKDDSTPIKSEFIGVVRSPELNCVYEIKTKEDNLQYFYKDGSLYTYNILLNQKGKSDISSLDFLQTMDSELKSIGKMFDSKYISKIEGYAFAFDNKPGVKNIECSFYAKTLKEYNIVDTQYDKISMSVRIDPESNKMFYFKAEFKADKTCLTYIFGSDIYNDQYGVLKERFKFPNDLDEYKVR